jgi:glycosyltransferase involved in cell wall biosynthesis
MTRRAVFLINLVQDVNIVRPLALLAAREAGMAVAFLVSDKFHVRDKQGIWRIELDRLAASTRASVTVYDSPFTVFQALAGHSGVLVAASESDLTAHAQTHDAMLAAPAGFLKITLQHGYECVGFLHSGAHERAHGKTVGFAADVVAGWTPAALQRSLSANERAKYYLSGPTALIPAPGDTALLAPAEAEVLICENLHSVRFASDGGSRDAFTEAFNAFTLAMDTVGKAVALRSHPSGKRTFDRDTGVTNIRLANQPIYQLDLAGYRYAISPPSSVLIDLVLAGVPTAVWQDPDGDVEIDNYAGLSRVSLPGEFLAFRQAALADPEAMRERQRDFLTGTGILTSPGIVRERFLRLLNAGSGVVRVAPSPEDLGVLVVGDAVGATQWISFSQPLAGAADVQLTLAANDSGWSEPDAIDRFWDGVRPSVLILSRYTEDHAAALIARARRDGVPVVFHLDDDLLNVPESLGRSKFEHYNQPARLENLRTALQASDLVYASTGPLAKTLAGHGITTPIAAGDLYCSVRAETAPTPRRAAAPTIGYMATGGHNADLELALPAIISLMDALPDLRFETFGRVAAPRALTRFGDRVTHHPGIADYAAFLARLADLGWWAAIAPLEDTTFNRCKADTKWVEYSFAGIPTVASDLPVYRRGCESGCGFLAADESQWRDALGRLVQDENLRDATVERARRKLATVYSPQRLQGQLRGVIARARSLAEDNSGADRADTVETIS